MTQYERGVDQVERAIQHYYEYYHHYVMRSAGSHGPADLIINIKSEMLIVQAKLHIGLRDAVREQELRQLIVPSSVSKWIAWKEKIGRKIQIRFHNLVTDKEFIIIPLNRKQEKEYQARKKAYFAARRLSRKAQKILKVMVPNTRIR
jgi:Holliday junction resolvase